MTRLTKQFEKAYGAFELCDRISIKDHDRLLAFITAVVKERDAYVVGPHEEVKEEYPLHKKSIIMQKNHVREEILIRMKKTL